MPTTGRLICKKRENCYNKVNIGGKSLCLKDYFSLTGFPPLIPRYALGIWWNRDMIYSYDDTKNIVKSFNKFKIPLSVLLLSEFWHKKDKDDYKIIIGKKIVYNDDKVLLKIEKDNFNNELENIEKTIDESIHNSSYSEINLYYNHYNSSTSFEFKKLNLFPLKFEGEYYSNKDFVIETDITSMIYSLLTFYIMYQLRMCECISRAAENTIRNQITREAIDKIEQIEEEQSNKERKEKKSILINKTVDNYKKLSYMEADNG